MVKDLPAMQETQIQSLGWEDTLEKKMVTHSSIPAWRIPWTEESGGLQCVHCKQSDTTERLSLSLSHIVQIASFQEALHSLSHLTVSLLLIFSSAVKQQSTRVIGSNPH